MEKNDPFNYMKSARKMKIERPELKKVTELSVHNQVCKYLKAQYPNVMFLSDFGAGIKMSIGMANRQSMQKSNHAFPDLMIFEPRGGYYGLFIEVKRDRDALYNKNGTIKKSDHIDDQIKAVSFLNNRGYYANFACGFDEAKSIIDKYLSHPL